MSAIGFEPSGETALNSRGNPARPGAILRIGDLLVLEGLATSAQVQSALHGIPLGSALVWMTCTCGAALVRVAAFS
jgi:hypothetical protein